MQHPKTILVLNMVILVIVFFSKCLEDNSKKIHDQRGDQYAGAATCIGCHQKITASFPHTGHFKTSSAVNSSMLKKIIDTSKNYFYYMDSGYIRLEEKNNEFFQTLFLNNKKETGRRFDMAFGSAEKAQTY